MLLNEEEQSKISKSNLSMNPKIKKRKKISKINKYPFKKAKYVNEDNNEERISFTEHKNILNEYKEEMEFLRAKRKNPVSFDKCINYNIEKPNNIIICVDNTKFEKISKNENDNKLSNEKKNVKNYKNENIKISKLYDLYHHLFVKSGLESTKLSSFVDYLSSEMANVNEPNLQKKGKINFENIKKIILNLGNENIENTLIDKLIKEFYHCSFNHSIMEKFAKIINEIIINQNKYNIEIKNRDFNSFNDNNSLSIGIESSEKNSKAKRDKNSYSNILYEKLKNNNYDSCLSLTNDLDYFKSIVYLSNKYSINNNKNNLLDKTIIKSLETNRDLIKSFKEEKKEIANQNDANYLNNLLKNQKLKKYLNKKLNCFSQCFNNNILKILEKNNFNEIINLLINDNKEDKKKLKILNNISVPVSEKIKKTDISNFLILLCFMTCLTIINKNTNIISESDLSILNPIFQYICQFDNYLNLKLKNKKKKRMITINNKNRNKIKIRLDNTDTKESLNDNLTEERKIEEENKEENKEDRSKIIKIIVDNNDISIYSGNEELNNDKKVSNNNTYINEFFSLKLPLQNDNNKNIKKINNIQNNNDNIKYFNKNDLKDDLIDSNLNNNETVKNKIEINSKNKMDDNLSIFHKKLLRELSLGNDIFKLKYEKIREKKIKSINTNIIKENKYDQKEEKYNEISIEINEENVKIENENNININDNGLNNIKNKMLKKVGNKIIIYADNFSEENNNDSHINNSESNFKEKK